MSKQEHGSNSQAQLDAHLLDNLRSRKGRGSGWGSIGFKSGYLRQLRECLAAGGCKTAAGMPADDAAWERLIKEAEGRLVYSNAEMLANESSFLTPSSAKHQKAAKLSEGSILDFDAVITSDSKDRDGDILRTKGAKPDERMPLLWQHNSGDPIGKLVKITTHNSKRLVGRFAIADTQLGRDAATLVEFGALRISHGFQPLDYEPIYGGESKDDITGWDIKEFEIFEASLVSIPANPDAVIMAHSRGKLHHPAVKSWAEVFVAKSKSSRLSVNVPIDLSAKLSVDTAEARKQLDMLDGISGNKHADRHADSDLPPNHEPEQTAEGLSNDQQQEQSKTCQCAAGEKANLLSTLTERVKELEAELLEAGKELAAAKQSGEGSTGAGSFNGTDQLAGKESLNNVFAGVFAEIISAKDEDIELFLAFQRNLATSLTAWRESLDEREFAAALAEFESA